ncbi:putative RNA-binding Zn-ribbon protein involved in translation (DUF1610 family) [Halarchaeum rubridurum]|uniref:Putative RNA-binding Zn-ribbon protein involved in translation (DUF1610 family) n=1 Tax=Halarchaeum rubridurum TaxID=489911 RepID=A0A8T4GL74_9EURY|nr:putative RNA-binding Zn-ribbon protein involved in translation (DUF1610 family) [Halarchaeum rubridurum]
MTNNEPAIEIHQQTAFGDNGDLEVTEMSVETSLEEYGISVEVRSEAWTSQECPQCGSTDRTKRHQDTLTCPCGFEGHADLTASETFLKRHTEKAVRSMARPVRFEWDDHNWSGTPHPHESPKEQRTNPSTVHRDGNVASGESTTG